MRTLITGINGFAGSHLADFLLQQDNIEVWGTLRSKVGVIAPITSHLTLRYVDLRDPTVVHALLEECRPKRIYHLAGQAFVHISWKDPWPTLENNIRAQLNLLQAIIDLNLDTRILCVSSMEIYGRTKPKDLPINESTPLSPVSPYGVSKVAQDMLALQYFNSYGLYTIRARPFNHIGPRQNERFVASNFAKQIAEIELGLHPPMIKFGNLSAQRDFSDVRDMVRAYYLLLEQGTPGEAYNIGRGEPRSVRELLDILLNSTEIKIEERIDPDRLRPSDMPVSYADISKLQLITGWQPSVSFEDSLRHVLDYWRLRLRNIDNSFQSRK